MLPLNRIIALVVLVVAAIWVASGEFSSVGSAAHQDGTNEGPPAAAAAEPAALRTVAVKTPLVIDHQRIIRIAGLTRPDKRVALAARKNGIIDTLPVEEGHSIAQGAVIMTLQAEEAPAQIASAKALLAQREKEAEAAERLSARGNLGSLQLQAARAALAAAQSQLQQAEVNLDQTTLRAPFASVIDKVNVEAGSFVQTGTTIAVLLKLDPIKAVGALNETDLSQVALGDPANVSLVDGTITKGVISHISREATNNTRTFEIEVSIANADRRIPAGMTAEIAVRAQPLKAVVLPRSVIALSERGDLGIHAVNDDDKVVFVPIKIVDDTPEGLVLAGIAPGTRVIVAGQDMVSPGSQVDVAAVPDAEPGGNTAPNNTGSVN